MFLIISIISFESQIRMHTKTLVQCPKCPKMFNEESLRDHMRKFHAALSVCTICGAKVTLICILKIFIYLESHIHNL